MKTIALSVILVALGYLFACASSLSPPPPKQNGFPCNDPRKIACGVGTCCWEGDVCGADAPFSRCPASLCCFEDTDTRIGAARDAGRVNYPVFHEAP